MRTTTDKSIRGTEIGVPVPGVGELFWPPAYEVITGEDAPKYADETIWDWIRANEELERQGRRRRTQHYELPSEWGFALTLRLPPDDTEPGYGRYSHDTDPLQAFLGEDTEIDLIDEQRPFPVWLVRFAHDMQDWTHAAEVSIDYDRTSDGQNIDPDDLPLNKATITCSYYNQFNTYNEEPSISIKNTDVFIGSAATHLAQLYAEYTASP